MGGGGQAGTGGWRAGRAFCAVPRSAALAHARARSCCHGVSLTSPVVPQTETFIVGGKRVSLHTSVLDEKATGAGGHRAGHRGGAGGGRPWGGPPPAAATPCPARCPASLAACAPCPLPSLSRGVHLMPAALPLSRRAPHACCHPSLAAARRSLQHDLLLRRRAEGGLLSLRGAGGWGRLPWVVR